MRRRVGGDGAARRQMEFSRHIIFVVLFFCYCHSDHALLRFLPPHGEESFHSVETHHKYASRHWKIHTKWLSKNENVSNVDGIGDQLLMKVSHRKR
jgi:hypothetical protein